MVRFPVDAVAPDSMREKSRYATAVLQGNRMNRQLPPRHGEGWGGGGVSRRHKACGTPVAPIPLPTSPLEGGGEGAFSLHAIALGPAVNPVSGKRDTVFRD